MTENSWLWTTGGAGDGASTYTRTDWSNILKIVASCCGFQGVSGFLNNILAGSVTGVNAIAINTGGALVDGKPYLNNASLPVTIPSASGGGNTRIDRVVLRADWTLQTVRVTRIAGTDAASPTAPAVTTTTGVTYDIKLYQALVDTAGTVTLTDERQWAAIGSAVQIADAVITGAKLVNNTIGTAQLALDSVDDTIAGNRVPALTRRQGGNATDWNSPGTTTYTPTTVRMQTGSVITAAGGVATVTYPVAFSAIPVVQLTPVPASAANRMAMITTISSGSGFSLLLVDDAGATKAGEAVFWLAIGPE